MCVGGGGGGGAGGSLGEMRSKLDDLVIQFHVYSYTYIHGVHNAMVVWVIHCTIG